MEILDDERDHGSEGVCENCGRAGQVRPVEALGWLGESRGWYNICFKCFAPLITWRRRSRGRTTYHIFKTPVYDNAETSRKGGS